MSTAANTFVSVIIPTYRDWKRLALCIDALQKQTLPNALFEVIVVNNDPNDTAPADFVLPANAVLISESKKGSYAARNAGIQIAKGNITAFTDSDCIPDANWLQNAVDYFNEHDTCARIAGHVELFFKNSQPNIAELYETVFAFDQERFAKRDGAAVTANMISHKEVFDKVGVFDEQLLSGGDIAWGKKALRAGFKICYAKDVVVKHPARDTVRQLISKRLRVAGGTAIASKKSKVQSLKRLMKSFLPPKNSMSSIRKKGNHLNAAQKAEIYVLRYYLNVLCAFESFKVKTGKTPKR